MDRARTTISTRLRSLAGESHAQPVTLRGGLRPTPAGAETRSPSHCGSARQIRPATDRRMLEAARLLRFTSMSVGEVSYRAGFRDQLCFSRAFKRATSEAPSAYRERVRGRAREAA